MTETRNNAVDFISLREALEYYTFSIQTLGVLIMTGRISVNVTDKGIVSHLNGQDLEKLSAIKEAKEQRNFPLVDAVKTKGGQEYYTWRELEKMNVVSLSFQRITQLAREGKVDSFLDKTNNRNGIWYINLVDLLRYQNETKRGRPRE